MDTVPYTSYIRDVQHYNGINKALKSLVTTSSKWHFRFICLAVSLFDKQWVEIIFECVFLFLCTFILRIFFLICFMQVWIILKMNILLTRSNNQLWTYWYWIFLNLSPFLAKKPITFRQIKLVLVGQKIHKNWDS